MKKNIQFGLIFSFLLMVTILPAFSIVQADDKKDLVPCGTEREPTRDEFGNQLYDENGKPLGGKVINPCGANHIFELINRVVNFFLKNLVIPIAAICFAYAGFLLLFAGGRDEQVSKAKGIFTGIAIGLVIVAAAWLIINTLLLYIAGYRWDWTTFNV